MSGEIFDNNLAFINANYRQYIKVPDDNFLFLYNPESIYHLYF
jgi:hypothetical protein